MAGRLQIEVPPSVEPITLVQAKNHLRVTINNDDQLIAMMIQAARELVETYTARSIVNKGYRQAHDFFPYFSDRSQTMAAPAYYAASPRYATTQWNYSQEIKLLVSPLVSVQSIEYVKTDQTIGFLYPTLPSWYASTVYTLGDSIKDSNGNAQKVAMVSLPTDNPPSGPVDQASSGATVPTWATLLNATTTDGQLTWVCQGPAPSADFVVDTDGEPPRLFPPVGGNWPPTLNIPNAVKIHFTAGYGGSPPSVAVVAMLQALSNWYENRESVTDATLKQIPLHFESLLWSIRVMDFSPTPG